ncbi:MAG: TolC family protein, partial [Synechococcaceae cyanobacterium]|nr:TolC family protein [Synechococcaceae cyanobacterium]
MNFAPLQPLLTALLAGVLVLAVPRPSQADTRQRLINQAERLATVLEQRQIRLSKRDAVSQGLANNPELASAYQGISGRSWALISVRRSWFPSLQLVGSSNALRSTDPLLLGQTFSLRQVDQDSEQRTTTSVAGPGVVLNWTFFDLRRSAAINQALENLRAEEFLFDIAARTLTLNLQVAYTTVQARSDLLQRYDWLVQITREQVAKARALHAQGRLSASALDQLLTEERLQLTRLLERYQQLFLASNSLSALVAAPPGRYVLPSEP